MDSQIDNEYFERYKRHILIKNIGGLGQKKLGQAKVLLIGLGGIGSTVLQHLAASGIGKIGLVDQDIVALSNLQRQTIYKYKDINIIKGGMPPDYGGRLSSVLDITMNDGNNKKYQADGGIGLLSSRLTLQGPIQKEKSSFIVSGRRTYIDVLSKPFLNREDPETGEPNPFAGSGYYFMI